MKKLNPVLVAFLILVPSVSFASTLATQLASSYVPIPRSSSHAATGVPIVVFLVLAVVAVLLLAVVIYFISLFVGYSRSRQTLKSGVPATAKIVSLEDTRTRYNYEPVIAIHLEVMPKDQPPYTAVVERTITTSADRFSPGKMLQVKYDPAHPDRVAIVDVTP